VSKVTEKIKTRSKPTPSENFNSHPLLVNNTGAALAQVCNITFFLFLIIISFFSRGNRTTLVRFELSILTFLQNTLK
jgi:hypothetical protein